MSRSPRIPSYRLHKATGQAVVVLRGRSYYLGKFGSPTSKAEYRRLIHEYTAGGCLLPPGPSETDSPGKLHSSLTVAELLDAYWRHVKVYYRKDGKPTSEQDTIRQALRFVRKLYGHSPVRDFGGAALEAVREAMIQHPITRTVKVKDPETGEVRNEVRVLRVGLARTFVNEQIARIKRMFKWGAGKKLVPLAVFGELAAIGGLEAGRTLAREKPPVKPVLPEHVAATLSALPLTVRIMVEVQLLCGGRPQDMVEMRPGDIDRSQSIWEYRPGRHKNEHRGRERLVYLGPRAQELLRSLLEGLSPEEFVFSPLRSEQARLAALRAAKGEPPVKPERPRGKWQLRAKYDVASYRRAIRRACKRVSVPIWHPNQLRHTAGTNIRKQYGIEGSQAVLGHAELKSTQVYAEVSQDRARQIAAEVG